MQYRLYYTDFDVAKEAYEANKSRFMPYVYNELDDALGKARQIKSYGGVPWEIIGADGYVMNREVIADALQKRASELADRPKVY